MFEGERTEELVGIRVITEAMGAGLAVPALWGLLGHVYHNPPTCIIVEFPPG